MNKTLMFCAAALLAAGCSSKVKESLGLERSAPDEFAVIERAPLTLPPSFDLVPPTPGAPRPQEGTTSAAARGLVLGSESSAGRVPSASRAEQSLLNRAGAASADPQIQQKLDNPEELPPRTAAEKLGITKKTENALDPVEEAKRLKQDNVKTVPVTEDAAKDAAR